MERETYASSARERRPRDEGSGRRAGAVIGTVPEAPRPHPSAEERTEGAALMMQLKRQWKMIIGIGLAAAVLGAAVSLLLPPQYDAEAKIMVSVNAMQDVSSLSQGNDFSQQRVQTYITLATSRPVMEAVIEELGLDTTPEELAEAVTAEGVPETVLLRVIAREGDPLLAAEVADSVAENLMAEIEQIEQGGSESPALVRTVLVEAAAVPTETAAPSVPRNTAFALLAGLATAVLYVYLRGTLDTRIRSTEAITDDMGMTLLATIPRNTARASDPTVMTDYDPSGFSEAYRLLRTRLRYANADGKMNTIMISSVSEGEGKSSVASLLATALAESGLDVLLIDGDLRRPSIAAKFGLEGAVGLTAVLTRQATLQEAVQRSVETGVAVLAAGMLPPNPAELLESNSMRELIREARREFDLVLIDTPPTASTADATTVSTLADAVLFVVRADGKVTRRAVERATGSLSFVGSRVLGVVATFVKSDKVETASYY